MKISALALVAFLTLNNNKNDDNVCRWYGYHTAEALTTRPAHSRPATASPRGMTTIPLSSMRSRSGGTRNSRRLPVTTTRPITSSSLRMADEYVSLDFNDLLGDDGRQKQQSPDQQQQQQSSTSPKSKSKSESSNKKSVSKKNTNQKSSSTSASSSSQPKNKSQNRGSRQKERLEKDIQQAEIERLKIEQQLKETEVQAKQLEQSAKRYAQKVESNRQKLEAIQRRDEQIQRLLSGNIGGGAVGSVVGSLGVAVVAAAAARSALAQRAAKLQEEALLLEQQEQERLAKQAAAEAALKRRQTANQAVLVRFVGVFVVNAIECWRRTVKEGIGLVFFLVSQSLILTTSTFYLFFFVFFLITATVGSDCSNRCCIEWWS
jgi:hypothetical protein